MCISSIHYFCLKFTSYIVKENYFDGTIEKEEPSSQQNTQHWNKKWNIGPKIDVDAKNLSEDENYNDNNY